MWYTLCRTLILLLYHLCCIVQYGAQNDLKTSSLGQSVDVSCWHIARSPGLQELGPHLCKNLTPHCAN